MTAARELCLAIVKYFIDYGNKRFLLLVPSLPIKVIAFIRKLFPFHKIIVFTLRGHVT